MRALTTVRRVEAIVPIPGADAIDVATVDGWKVVVGKGQFDVGEPVVYFEIDAYLPREDPRFSPVMRTPMTWRGREGAKLSTMVFRGQISQGLALPLAAFPEVAAATAGMDFDAMREHDLSALVGVVKWEADIPAEIADAVVGALPSRLADTSLKRVQNLPTLFRDHAGRRFEVTTKVDGMSAHVFNVDGRVGVGCGEWELRERPDEPVWAAARRSGLVEAMGHRANVGLQVQAEVFGKATRAGYHEGREGSHLAVFGVYDTIRGRHLSSVERDDFLSSGLEASGIDPGRVERVPYLGILTLDQFDDVDAILAYAEGPSIDPSRRREGVVFRGVDGTFAFKAIANRQLAKAAKATRARIDPKPVLPSGP